MQLNPVLAGPDPDIIADCVGFASKPAATIRWITGDIEHTSKENITQHSNGTATIWSQLRMVPSLSLYGKEASCVISQPDGMFDKRIIFTFTNIQFAPESFNFTVGRNNEDPPYIKCNANGNPTVYYSWTRDTVPHDGVWVKSNPLYLSDKDVETDGLYFCEATNSIGKNSQSVFIYKDKGTSHNAHSGVYIAIIVLQALLIITGVGVYFWKKRTSESRDPGL
ncbi:hypothetical protein GDO86_002651 [Hymenochirus boettgeri]|uniref:Ig-like domain-containing protein n=1 Tax=Hymenochirus boettgeri TaxID=247094 RepID=A0A8T2K2U5_9PIPI|nr:hypothetical protein GDO86_002651 [Hymenochirus boettgeri]